ncbi:ribosome maturation factor RimP [soil metagenome]
MADLADTIDSLARPLAEDAGLDLLDIELKAAGSRTRIRIVVDRKGGVDVGSCQTLSRAIGRAVDEADPSAERYVLEVTSPGTDRPLTDQASFDRAEGRPVKVVLRDGVDAEREVRGTIGPAGEDAVDVIDADSDVHTLPYDQIVTARQELPW